MTNKHPSLFSPFMLTEKIKLRNRIVMAPMTTWSANPDGTISEQELEFYKRRSQNVGLGEAAKRNVGTGENQIPDMSSYASGSGWRKMPDGSIEQWGRISFPGEHGPVSANVSFPIPFTQTPGIVIVCDGGFGGGNMWGATNWSTTGFIAHCNYGLEGGAFFAKGW
ncbi:TPA: hypothetical protein HJJ11_002003 [Escherichia coli]|nr:hypothetical protein [Escherichia coli]HAI2645854.1 hypothetical protein [Escherichia coli]